MVPFYSIYAKYLICLFLGMGEVFAHTALYSLSTW